ncbi:hypothetical protein SAMN05216299_11525 [Nitrosospira sp. Nsp14]|nr:hypothetical protein SAMN05216299_11525 [Nitrosospira sp. Nsp14]
MSIVMIELDQWQPGRLIELGNPQHHMFKLDFDLFQ